MKFLVVDDSKTMLRIITNVIKRLGYNDIDTALDGQEAWDKIQINKYEIVLTDINMPIMNGYELMEKIRDYPPYEGIPVVAITTEGGKSSVIKALKLGCANYIIKPFTPQILKEKLSVILGLD